MAPYVDNFNAVCWDARDAAAYLKALTDLLSRWNLAFRVECDGSSSWAIVGIILGANRKMVHAKPDRLWRLRGAALELADQGRCTGGVMRKIIGHLGLFAIACRPLLAVF